MRNTLIIFSLTLALIVTIFGQFLSYRPEIANGSVAQGGTYQSANLAPTQTNASFLQSTTLSTTTGGGTLGSVVITGIGAGYFTIYDATTSNATLRAVAATTSLSVLAQFPTSAAVGTYTFDERFTNGIAVEFTGAQGTSTITYRSY